jgi:hypothetical protein
MDTKVRKTSVQDTGPAPCLACRTHVGARHRPKATKNELEKPSISRAAAKKFWLDLFA